MPKSPAFPGDLFLVRYYHGDIAQEGIAFFEQSKFVHVLCSLGGYEIIEADTGGVRWTDLRDYMIRGDCDLALMRSKYWNANGAKTAVEYWKSCVKKNDSYSFLGDARLGLGLIAARLGAGRLIRLLPDGLLRNSHQKFCSQLGIAGLQEGILYPRAADSFNFSPSML
ncbi:MAG: hypothetical protein KGJ13_10465, partial [Patescibacteria group bacterium]|nr:hypothetical protein [Patescibacteria group bacterium]